MTAELSEARKQYIRQDYSRGFIAYCGLEAVDVELGTVRARLSVQPHHRQQDGFIHAGVMTAMADHTAGYAAFTMVPEDRRILTIELKINFLRPAYGDELTCRGRVLKPGRRVLICESEVFDRRPDGDVMVAKLLATMAAVPEADLKRAQ